jgi:hypothetical protein
MSFDAIIALQEKGAETRALGADAKDNPFLKAGTTTGTSDETENEWRERRDAWHFGWAIENAYRAA